MEIQFIGNGTRSRSLSHSSGLIKNLYPEKSLTGRNPVSLVGTPGLRLFTTLPTGAVDDLIELRDVLYAVSGGVFYRIEANGASSQRGTVPTGIKPRLSAIQDQIGIAVGSFYSYNVATDTFAETNLPTEVTTDSSAIIGQQLALSRTGTGEFYLTGFQDLTSVNALDFANAESFPDNLVAVHRFGSQLWLLGRNSSEIWTLTPSSFPASRIPGGAFEVGLGARLSVASDENYIAWLSHSGRIYASVGGRPVVISSPDLEYDIAQLASLSDAEAFMYTEEGHQFYQITFPADGRTFVYDFREQWWHERCTGTTRHAASCFARCYGKNLVGDYRNGNIYELTMGAGDDNGERIRREFITPPVHNNGAMIAFGGIELLAETGITPVADETDVVQLRWSPTGGDWSNWVDRSLGERGQRRTRLTWEGLGSDYERHFHFRTSTRGDVRFSNLVLNADA